jgi:hypothetical protein
MRGFHARTGVFASFPRWDMLLRSFFGGTDISLGFLDGTAIRARFSVWDSCPCEVSMMGKIYPRGFQDWMDIPAWFPGWDICLRSFKNGTDILVRSGRGRYSCEFPMKGQFFLRGVQDGTFRRVFHIGTYYCEVSRMRQIFVRVSQDRTDDLRCSQDTSRCRLKWWGTSSCEFRG